LDCRDEDLSSLCEAATDPLGQAQDFTLELIFLSQCLVVSDEMIIHAERLGSHASKKPVPGTLTNRSRALRSPMRAISPIILFALIVAATFSAADALVIPLVMRPLFQSVLGDQMLQTLRLGPAALFYLIHISGLVYFAGLPVLRGGSARRAMLDGAMLGFVAYSCYEMTSFTIMRDWTTTLVLIDLAWGTIISGFSAWLGALGVVRMRR
jgi:uncharacterized membrane protein